MKVFGRSLVALALAASFPLISMARDAGSADTEWKKDLSTWREDRAQQLTRPDGWLTLVGLEWLKPGENTVGLTQSKEIKTNDPKAKTIALFNLKPDGVYLSQPAGGFASDLKENGSVLQPGKISSDNGKNAQFAIGDITFFVIQRGDKTGLRIKNTNAPTRVQFKGLHWYAPNLSYRVTAEWIPFPKPLTITVANVVGSTFTAETYGVARFTVNGQTTELTPVIEGKDDKELFFIVRDGTSSITTYGASRFLYSELPSNGLSKPGKLVLDFNRLQNPPCAYTPYATCPLPPKQNRLSVKLEAGEQKYSH